MTGRSPTMLTCSSRETRPTIFYFTHPEVTGMAPADFVWTYAARRTSLQAAKLELEGGMLVCDRDAPFELELAARGGG